MMIYATLLSHKKVFAFFRIIIFYIFGIKENVYVQQSKNYRTTKPYLGGGKWGIAPSEIGKVPLIFCFRRVKAAKVQRFASSETDLSSPTKNSVYGLLVLKSVHN